MSSQAWYDSFYAARAQRAEKMDPWYELILAAMERDGVSAADEILELGCGEATLLLALRDAGFAPERLHGIEQSSVAFEAARLAGIDVRAGNVMTALPFADGSMSALVLAEVIEHLESPDGTLAEIVRVLRPGGRFYLTFPNFVNLPWLAARIAAQVFNHPEWIVLQPTDRIYFYPGLKARVERTGLRFERSTGSIFLPPILYHRETPSLRKTLTAAGLAPLSFHPLLVFSKPT
jgi:SAM-dependent methyltransferase